MIELEKNINENLHFKTLELVKENEKKIVKNLQGPRNVEKTKTTDLLDPDWYEIIKSKNGKTIIMDKYSETNKGSFTNGNIFLQETNGEFKKLEINKKNNQYNKNNVISFLNEKQFEENGNIVLTIQDLLEKGDKHDDKYKLYINGISSKEYSIKERYNKNKLPEIQGSLINMKKIDDIKVDEENKKVSFSLEGKKYEMVENGEITEIKKVE